MRLLLILAGLALAAPALAQTPLVPPLYPPGLTGAVTAQYSAWLVQQEQARQQAIQQQNDLARLQARMQLEQGLAIIESERNAPRFPQTDVSGSQPYPQVDVSQLPTISDRTLAESNKRVLEAAQNGP